MLIEQVISFQPNLLLSPSLNKIKYKNLLACFLWRDQDNATGAFLPDWFMKYVVEEGKEKVMEVDDNDFQRANESHYNHQLHQVVEYIGHWFTNTSSDCFKIVLNFIVCSVYSIINYILKLIMEYRQILKSGYFVGQVWSMFTPCFFFSFIMCLKCSSNVRRITITQKPKLIIVSRY